MEWSYNEILHKLDINIYLAIAIGSLDLVGSTQRDLFFATAFNGNPNSKGNSTLTEIKFRRDMN